MRREPEPIRSWTWPHQQLVCLTASGLSRLCGGFRVYGQEKVPDGGALVAANHISYFDPPVVVNGPFFAGFYIGGGIDPASAPAVATDDNPVLCSSYNMWDESVGWVDLSNNEMAKLHVRHMVGGRSAQLQHERLYRFEFPERPGALLDFLHAIGTDWNISLFHYRNHGSDHGRILVGIEVPESDTQLLESHLARLGYSHWEESDNPAYKMFLS